MLEVTSLILERGPSHESESHERLFILLPAIASVDGCSAAAWFWMTAALAVEGDHVVDDVSAVHAS